MKRPPKIKFTPIEKILKMKFRELKENGLIKKSWTKKPDLRLFDNLGFETLRDLEMVNETELKYNRIRENVVWYSQFGMSRKEAIERVAADFYISPKSISHILYRKIKK
jgi:hypothetical protein